MLHPIRMDLGLQDTSAWLNGLEESWQERILSANEIESIEALRDCRQLKQLYLTKNPLSDLRPLQELPFLEELNLSKTLVTDLSPLAFVPKLRSLDLSETATALTGKSIFRPSRAV